MEQPAPAVVVVTPAKRYRVTRHSIVWFVAILTLVPYELYMVARGVDGGPLTHVVKWAYGPQRSLRWWLLGFANSGFLLWMVPHFLFEGWDEYHLAAFVGAGLLVGLLGFLVTR